MSTQSDLEALSMMFGSLLIFGMVMVIMLVICVPLYIWQSYELQKALKRLCYDKPWMAWIPFANYYAMASVCDEENGKVNVIGLQVDATLFKFWWAIGLALAFVPVFGSMLNVALTVICAGKCYSTIFSKLERLSEKDVAVKAYLSPVILFVAPICLTLANNKADQLGNQYFAYHHPEQTYENVSEPQQKETNTVDLSK